ncbi:unnamed protein product [Ilex paraguariensis]|uniref:Uncharacterized protein n=1 Tax=Ilex paraguariensis TaxID=185542 RepID=A0ABC8RN58_9AQUA
MARKSKGRQKIEMIRMSKESNLLVIILKESFWSLAIELLHPLVKKLPLSSSLLVTLMFNPSLIVGMREEARQRARQIEEGKPREVVWWEGPIVKLGVQELQQLKVAMAELKKNVAKQQAHIHGFYSILKKKCVDAHNEGDM